MENLFKLVNLPNYSRYLLILPIGSVFLIPFIAKTQGSSILTTVLIIGILLFTLCIELIYIASIQALNKDHEKINDDAFMYVSSSLWLRRQRRSCERREYQPLIG